MRKGWATTALGDLAQINPESLGARTPEDYEFGYIDLSMVNEGHITYPTDRIKYKDASPRARRIARKGDILMATVRPNLKSFGHVQSSAKALICSTGFAVLRCKHQETAEYLYQYIFSHFIESQIDALVVGSNYPAINNEDVRDLQVFIPKNIAEQKKIATILRTWDEAVMRMSNLLAAHTRKKQALQQKLLSGKIRLPGFSGQWKIWKLKDLTEELKGRNQGNKIDANKIMGVNKFYGLIPMREETIGASIDRYKKVPPDAFAYNPMRINIGSLARSHYNYPVLVSPDYVVFSCTPKKLSADYFDHFRRSHTWEKYMEAAGNGSVRIRIYYNDLGDLKIRLPGIKEQKAIAAILNACDQQLQLIEKEIEALKAQKRGLMQKLLTGEWSVRVDKEAA